MSRIPYILKKARFGYRLRGGDLLDSMPVPAMKLVEVVRGLLTDLIGVVPVY